MSFIIVWKVAGLLVIPKNIMRGSKRPPLDVKLGEVLGSAELGDKFGDEGEGIPVLDGYGVQCAIVLDQLERTVLLFNEEYWGCDGGLGGSDLSGTQVLL